MRRTTSRFPRAATALALAALLVGCPAPKAAETGESGAPASGDRPTLTFYTSLSQAEWAVLKHDVFPPFEKANGCVVRGVEVPVSDLANKLYAMRASGKTDVDVVAQDNMKLWSLVKEGLVTDLSAHRAEIPEATIPALVPVGEFGGKLYFMPYRPNVEITFYDAAHFDRLGLQPPRTWDELKHVAHVTKQADGVGRVAIKADGTDAGTVHLFDFMNQAGGDPLKLNDAGCKQAFSFLKELWPDLSPESRRADFNTMNQFLATESVYLGQNWPYGIEVIVNQGEKKQVKAYSGWSGPAKEAHTLGGEVLAIPTGAPHPELAMDFIRYLQSAPVQSTFVAKLAWPAMRTDAYAEVEPWKKPYFDVVKEALEHTVARPNVPYWEAFDKHINAAFREIVVEGKPIEATLDAHAAALEAAKAEAAETSSR